MNTSASTAGRPAARATRLVLVASVCFRLAATDVSAASTENASQISTQSVVLSYEETDRPIGFWRCVVTPRQDRFEREPDVSPTETHRGKLTIGETRSVGIAFLWDIKAGRLYFDLNNNGDLTDDTNGAFKCESGPRPGLRYQTFPGVRLNMPTSSGNFPVLLELNMSGYGAVRAYANPRSFFSGRLTIRNRDWQIGVVASPATGEGIGSGCVLVLRPWEDRQRPFRVGSGTLETFDFSPRLFFQGNAWRVEGAFDLRASPPVCQLDLIPQEVALGEVRFSGRFLHRVVLKGDDWTAVVDEPDGPVRVPVGRYGTTLVHLRCGKAEAHLAEGGTVLDKPPQIVVSADQPASLALGGPLTNSVALRQRGHTLVMDYRLVGAGGQAYELAQPDRRNPPRFAIYHGDRKIASGNFEFG